MKKRYYARSASDKTDDWPHWFVADGQKGGLNVTCELIGVTFTSREMAGKLAVYANEEGIHRD